MIDKPGLCANCKKRILKDQRWVFAYGVYFHREKVGKCKGFRWMFPKFYQGVDID